MEQFRVNAEGQLERAVFQPVDEAQLQAEAANNEAAHNQAQAELQQLDEAVKNAEAALQAVNDERAGKVQQAAEAEAAHLKSQALVTAVQQARERGPVEPAEPVEAEGDGENAGEGSGQANGDIPVHVAEGEPQPA